MSRASGTGQGGPGNGRSAVVVGGGIAGLASAALLGREGYAVTLLEARAELGGRAGLWRSDGFAFDTGPSWYLMPEVFDHFFRLLGSSAAEQLDLVALDPAYRVFFEEHDPLDVRSDRADAVGLFERIEPGAGARLEAYLDSAADTYEMAKRYFLYTSFASYLPLLTRDVLQRGPELARLLLVSLERRVGRDFRDTRLRQVLGYPAVFLGSSPRLTPSMYHLMSHLDLTDAVLYPRGGFARLIEALADLARAEGVDVRTGARVTAVRTTPAGGAGNGARGADDGPGARAGAGPAARAAHRLAGRLRRAGTRARATGVEYRDAAGQVHRVEADVVVSTADLFHTEQELLPPRLRSRSPRWWSRRTPGPSAVLVYLGVTGALPELEHHSLFFTQDWQRSFDHVFPSAGTPSGPFPDPTSLYVCRPSATDPDVAPPGHENVFILVPVPADPGLGGGGEDGAGDPWVEAVADAAVAQVAAWAGVPDLAERVVVRKTVGPADFAGDLGTWRGNALGLAHTLQQSAMLRAGNTSRRVAGLYFAGSTVIPGIGLPMCLISAEILLKRLRGDTSTGPLAEPLRARGGSEREGEP
ncbi:phytoene desaturase family protein [Georgenia wangjunii]|uniref:phytoene desaturase family protein n=1 Tax=Georgenia wangjunii TaxID=3117730 RepID=UPI002F260FE7